MPRPNPVSETLYTLLGLCAVLVRGVMWGLWAAAWAFAIWLAVMLIWAVSLVFPRT